MTEKQEKILKAALELFASQGYHVTSTSKVARLAGVSEGLIFRHFENKEGLLMAIIREGEERFKNLYAEIVMETDPKKIIAKSLLIPFSIKESEYEFWKLQYKLKWELGNYNKEKLEPLRLTLSNAFKKLAYPHPDLEAELVLHMMDGIGGAILKGVVSDRNKLKQFLLKKYEL